MKEKEKEEEGNKGREDKGHLKEVSEISKQKF